MIKRKKSFIMALFWILLLQTMILADIKLHGLFTDNMVIQREINVPVWGWADDNEKITITFNGQTSSATAKNGQWKLILKPMKNLNMRSSIPLCDFLIVMIWYRYCILYLYFKEKNLQRDSNPSILSKIIKKW